ncbi:putative gamma-secretase subunit PEN-2 [Sesamum angolense]|uniref:Gamma-secretase subunit PEN-2 n=1 Tax=Sesamum angolense TaxID=2727404 RepID=A0AAE1XDM8_9LAMI|nr:putative gamma-secretase subunit PEN-2 [Sesamum angolense]
MDNQSGTDRYPNPAAAGILPTSSTSDGTSSSRRRLGPAEWPTIDGPLGLSHDESLDHARRFFKLGFLCLPFLWAVNCFYFWPVLRHPNSHGSHPDLRRLTSVPAYACSCSYVHKTGFNNHPITI